MENAQSLPAMMILKIAWSLMQIAEEAAKNVLMAKNAMRIPIAALIHALMEYVLKQIRAKMEL